MSTRKRIAREDLITGNISLNGEPLRCVLCSGIGGTPFWYSSVDHAEGCVLADVDVTAIWLEGVSEVRSEICIPCGAGNQCPAPGGWGNDTHRRLLITCERYREEDAKL